MKIVDRPNLPFGEVDRIIIGEKYRKQLENAIIKYNLNPIWLPDNQYTDERLSGHADLSAVHIGGNKLVLREYLRHCEQINEINNLGFDKCYINNCGKRYPQDAGLNICIVGDKLICNPDTAAVKPEGFKMIPVKQGYTKCSVCVVDENSIITQDIIISERASKAGMNVLYISKPFVRLEGFECGFIGGASFKLSKEKLAFTGVIKDSSIRNTIEIFLHERSIEAVFLTNEEIFDIGSAIPLTEKCC